MPGLLEGVRQQFAEQGAVRQAGQGVAVDGDIELLFGLAPLRDVGVRTAPAARLAGGVAHPPGHMLDPALAAVGGADAARERGAFGLAAVRPARFPGRQVGRLDDFLHQAGIGEKVGRRITGYGAAGRRDVQVAAVLGHPVFPVRRVIGQDAVFFFAFLEQGGALGHLPFEVAPQPAQFEVGAHARAHFLDIEGLGDVIGRAQREAFELVLRLVGHGDENDRNAVVLRQGLEVLAYLVAAHAGHPDVEQNQVGRRRALHQLDGPGAGIGQHDAVLVAQAFQQAVQVLRHVVDQQHAWHAGRLGAGRLLELGRIGAVALQGQLGIDAQEQQFRVDRLGDVVRHAQFEAAGHVGRVVQRGDENHRDMAGRRVRFQA